MRMFKQLLMLTLGLLALHSPQIASAQTTPYEGTTPEEGAQATVGCVCNLNCPPVCQDVSTESISQSSYAVAGRTKCKL